jgi:hypothetical protein
MCAMCWTTSNRLHFLPLNILRITSKLLIICLAISLTNCDNDRVSDQNSPNLPTGTSHIPEDGKLTQTQLTKYIAIRSQIINAVEQQRRSIRTKAVPPAADSVPGVDYRYFDEIEKQASLSLNMGYSEYLWIKDTVITTQSTIQVQKYYELNNRIIGLLDNTLNRYQETNTAKFDKQERQQMTDYVDEMKQEIVRLRGKMLSPDDMPEALKHNIAIVEKYGKQLEDLEQQSLSATTNKKE